MGYSSSTVGLILFLCSASSPISASANELCCLTLTPYQLLSLGLFSLESTGYTFLCFETFFDLDFIFKRWTVRPLDFFKKRLVCLIYFTYRNERKLKHGFSHLFRHHDGFLLLIFFLDCISHLICMFDHRFKLIWIQGVNNIKEVSLVNLSTLWKIIWQIYFHLWTWLKLHIKLLDTDFRPRTNMDLLEVTKFEKPLFTCEDFLEPLFGHLIIWRSVKLPKEEQGQEKWEVTYKLVLKYVMKSVLLLKAWDTC